MNILIIGSGGQLGTDCIEVLAQKHTLAAVDFPEIDDARVLHRTRPTPGGTSRTSSLAPSRPTRFVTLSWIT